jgi:uncharacterized protein
MTARVLVERDLPIPMRDGVITRADLYRPDGDEPLPVLLQRTPYGKAFAEPAFALMAAERGYAVLIQDTRGRWSSGGEDYPLRYEQQDGYDSVQWAAGQPWSNGRIGMYGASYVGYTQFAAAAAHPPALKTIIPAFTFLDPYRMFYHNGVLSLGLGASWTLLAGAQMAIERQSDPAAKARLWSQLVEQVDGLSRGETFRRLPLTELPLIGQPPAAGGLVSFFSDALQHPNPDAYWAELACPPQDIHVPALHVSGWYDVFQAASLNDFSAIRQLSDDTWVRSQQKLIVGPWVHADFNASAGEVDFGLQASWMFVLPEETRLRWFDYWLKGAPNGMLAEPPVRIFVMGANRWRDEQEWPLARAMPTSFYLHSLGNANSLSGDGRLNQKAPAEEAPDQFSYDPTDPVPTRGGGLCCWQPALMPGAFDQRPIEARPDVLVYTSQPLDEELEVTGPLEVLLWVASSATDTDFTAKLVDVSPDGFARNLSDGIARASLATISGATFRPEQPAEIRIDLGSTSNLFKTGHCLRLEISSSNFPRFERNPNTGLRPAESASLQTAHQTILHDSQHPSRLILPVV